MEEVDQPGQLAPGLQATLPFRAALFRIFSVDPEGNRSSIGDIPVIVESPAIRNIPGIPKAADFAISIHVGQKTESGASTRLDRSEFRLFRLAKWRWTSRWIP